MLDANAKHRMLFFPNGIWREIASYLQPQDIENLKAVCRMLYDTFSNLESGISLPFFNSLRKIDSTISSQGPRAQMQVLFLKVMQKIDEQQRNELSYFQDELKSANKNHSIIKSAIVEEKLQQIANIKAPATTLREIELRHRVLNDINAELIQYAIQTQISESGILENLKLNSPYFSVTRLPTNVFTDPMYVKVWKNLKVLDCKNQQIQLISKEIKNCRALEILNLSNNNLEFLPDEITQCKTLSSLACDNNQLKSLPVNLAHLENIHTLSFVGNLLQSLPAIPDDCATLYLARNHLLDIPEILEDKFGEGWAAITLENQKKRSLSYFAAKKHPSQTTTSESFISGILRKVSSAITSYFYPAAKPAESDSEDDSDSSYDLDPSQSDNDKNDELDSQSDSNEFTSSSSENRIFEISDSDDERMQHDATNEIIELSDSTDDEPQSESENDMIEISQDDGDERAKRRKFRA